MKAAKNVLYKPAPIRKAIEASPLKKVKKELCTECRVGNAFHEWRDQHLTGSYNWEIDFTSYGNIPAGKRLVIELVTATISVPSGEKARLRMFTSLGTAASNFDLVLTIQGSVGGRDLLVATHSLRAYSDTPVAFNVNRDNAQTEGDAFICISGYMIDV